MKIKTIYLDFDGVIVDSISTICKMYNEDFWYYPNFKIASPEEIFSWNFSELEYISNELIDFYFNSKRFFSIAQPLSQACMNILLRHYDVKIVTLGTEQNIRAKEEWLQKYFPQYDSNNLIGLDSFKCGDKSSIDMSDGLLIDDNDKNLITSNAAMKICFGRETDYNRNTKYQRARTWQELLFLLTHDFIDMADDI